MRRRTSTASGGSPLLGALSCPKLIAQGWTCSFERPNVAVNLTAFSNQTSQGEGGGAQPGYPNDHHSDEHSNPIADSLSSSEAESHNQTFTGKRISLAPSAYVFICSSFARQSPPASLGSICLSVSLFALSEWFQNPATIILTSAALQALRFCPSARSRVTARSPHVRALAPQ